MKILLWKIGALGDVLMTTPLVRQLRRAHPQARIDYLVGQGCAVVLRGNPHLSHVVEFDESILFRRQPTRLPQVLAALRGYDVVYVLDKHWIFSWLALTAGAPRRIGFRRSGFEGWPHHVAVPYGPLRHEIDCYLDLAEAAGVAVDRGDRALELPPAQDYPVQGPFVVAINSGGNNPGESSEVRKLPAPLFAQLVAGLAADQRVVFLGAPGEHAAYEPLARRHGALNLCGRTTLPQAWSVLAQARAVYSTDTGLMHMAAAAGAPVVGIFGPTHPLRKAPPGARWVWGDAGRYQAGYELRGRVPRGPFFSGLRVDDVVQAASAPSPSSAQPLAG